MLRARPVAARRLVKNGSALTRSVSALCSTAAAKAGAKSPSALALRTMSSSPAARVAAPISLVSMSVLVLPGFTSKATCPRPRHQLAQELQTLRRQQSGVQVDAGGVAAARARSCPRARDEPGRSRSRTGSEWSRSRTSPPAPTWRRRSRRSPRPCVGPDRRPAPAAGRIDPPPNGIRSRRYDPRHSPLRPSPGGKAPDIGTNWSRATVWRKPMTGTVCAGAGATSSHAANPPPRKVTNSHRRIGSALDPRARGHALPPEKCDTRRYEVV